MWGGRHRATVVGGGYPRPMAIVDRLVVRAGVTPGVAFAGRVTRSILGIRTRPRGAATRWAGVVCLLAVAATAALTACLAARRTDTAFARRLSSSNAADVNLSANAAAIGPAARAPLDEIDGEELVVDHARYGGVYLLPVHRGEIDPEFLTGTATGYVAYDTRAGRTISTLRVVDGRRASLDRADEVMVNAEWVRISGWGTGTSLPGMKLFQLPDLDENQNPDPDKGTPLSLHVVGVVSMPEEDIARGERVPRVLLTPAFAQRFPDAPYYYQDLLTLRHSASDVPKLKAAVARVSARAPDAQLFISDNALGLKKAERANDPLVNALWMLGALAAIVGLVLAAQSCTRVFQMHTDEQAHLRTLGATRAQRFSVEMLGAVGALALATALAVTVAWLLSPITPVGEARDSEPHAGFVLHTGLAFAAAFTFVVVGSLVVARPAWKVASSTALPGPSTNAGRDRVSHIASVAAGLGLNVPALMGTRLALQPGRGRTATPVRSVLVSLTLVVAAVTGVVAFDVNLHRLTNTPRLYGWNWDAAVGSSFGTVPSDAIPQLTRDDRLAGAAGLTLGELRIGRMAVPAIGVQPLSGHLTPRIEEGRLPRTTDEIALGTKTLRRAHAHIGDTISATVNGQVRRLRVVATATFPAFGLSRFSEAGLGTGALGAADVFPQPDPAGKYNYVLLRYKTSVPKASAIASLRRQVSDAGCVDSDCVLTDLRPSEIDAFRNAGGVPVPVAVMLTLLLAATLAHVLLSTLRRRTGDLAVLHALGCVRNQMAATLRWQTIVLTGSAVLIGVPLGLLANQFAWRAFTHQFGISPGTVLPTALVAAGTIATLTVAWLVGTTGGRRAQRFVREYRFPA
jgi:putative ABC transport system permease protein